MAGIIGVMKLQKDLDINTQKLLIKMSEVIKHEDWYEIDNFLTATIGLARVHLGVLNPEPQPIFNEDNSICIMMDGEIYDYAKTKADLIAKGHRFTINNDPEFVLHLYEEYGENFANNLNGSFVIAIWDIKEDKLMISNDRYGLRPLYYTKNDSKLIFASEVKAILVDDDFKREVNDEAVSDFFSFGYVLGTKTFFNNIHLLPAASTLICQKGDIAIKTYWNFDFKKDYEEHSDDYYVKRLSKLLLQAVERRMQGNHRVGTLLSGGMDSRAVLGAIDKKHYPIDTYTYGRPNCWDAKIAQQVAKELGTRHHFFALPQNHLVTSAEKTVYMTDGMKNCVHTHSVGYNEIKKTSDVIISGLIGDTILGGSHINDKVLSAQDITDLAEKVFKKINRFIRPEIAPRFFSDAYYKKIEGMAFKSFNDEFRETVHDVNHVSYFFIRNFGMRFLTLGHVIGNNQLEYRIPSCDNDLTDFVFTIPGKLLSNQYIYRKTFMKLFPELAKISWQTTGLPITASEYPYYLPKLSFRTLWQSKRFFIHRIIRRLITLAYGVINKPFKIIGYGPIIVDKKWNWDYENWMRKNDLRDYIMNILLDERTLSRSYFNKTYIKEILDSHMNYREDNWELIGLLLTFELWHRQFMDN